MPTSKAQKLRKAYEFKLGKKLTSKLSDEQISLLSKFYNSLSEAEQRKIDSKIFKGETNDLFDMAKTMSEENTGTYKTKSVKIKSTKISPAKLFGEDKYQKYISELVSQGTIEGRELTPTERKEGFKKRNNKVSFEKFVEKIVTTKAAKAAAKVKPPIAVGSTFLGGPIVKSPSSAIQKFVGNKDTQTKTGEDISSILSSIDSILETLRKQQKIEKLTDQYQRRKSEQEKRKLAENKLEKRFKNLKKAAEKIIAPVKGILDKIINFFTQILLGRVVYKLIEWMGDPKNARKIKSIIRFLGDNWPKLLSLYLIFGTSLGKFVRSLVKIAVRGTAKLIAVTAKLASKVIGGKLGGKLGNFGRFLGGRKGKLLTAGLEAAVTIGGTVALTKGLEGGLGEEQNTKPQKFSGGGQVKPKLPTFSGGGFNFKGMLGGSSFGSMFGPVGGAGNMQSGYVSGEKGVDKVPAMLSDGEFVMSRGAVQKYGVDTLESMNAAGGGTNKPKIMSGTTYAAGGGLIGDARKGLIDVYNWFNSQGVNLQDPDTWSGTGGKFATGVMSGLRQSANQVGNYGMNQFSRANNYLASGGLEKDISKLMQSGTQFGAGLYDQALKVGNQALSDIQSGKLQNQVMNTASRASQIPKNAGLGIFDTFKNIGSNKGYKKYSETVEKSQDKLITLNDKFIKNIPDGPFREMLDKGIIGIPSGNPTMMRNLTFVKAMLGPLGKPFRILSNKQVDEMRRKTIEKTMGKSGLIVDPKTGQVRMNWNQEDINKAARGGGAYTDDLGPGGSAFNSILGRFAAKTEGGGNVLYTDDRYNFNKTVAEYAEMAKQGLLKGSISDATYFGASMLGRFAQDIGWLNQRALGSRIKIGEVDRSSLDPATGKKRTDSQMKLEASKIAKKRINEEKLIAKRPWYDKFGWFGGGSGVVQNNLKGQKDVNEKAAQAYAASKGKYYSSTTGKTYSSYSDALKDPAIASSIKKTQQKAQIAKTPPKQASVKPSTQSKPKVTVISKPKYQGKGARRSSASKTPNFSAGSKSRTKINILGISI